MVGSGDIARSGGTQWTGRRLDSGTGGGRLPRSRTQSARVGTYDEGFREGVKYQRKRSSTALAVQSDSPRPGRGGRHERPRDPLRTISSPRRSSRRGESIVGTVGTVRMSGTVGARTMGDRPPRASHRGRSRRRPRRCARAGRGGTLRLRSGARVHPALRRAHGAARLAARVTPGRGDQSRGPR